jgi:hypothetical protein
MGRPGHLVSRGPVPAASGRRRPASVVTSGGAPEGRDECVGGGRQARPSDFRGGRLHIRATFPSVRREAAPIRPVNHDQARPATDAPTPLPDALPAALADRYTLVAPLGTGGMATVWRAHDRRHDRDVALKLMRADLTESLARERFLREIRVAARLTHPHILSLHDSGEAGGLLWFATPVLEGQSLRDRLERVGRLPVDEALRIAGEVADALDDAHRHDSLVAEIGLGDETRLAELLALTATREAGVISLGTTVRPELEALASHPTLGALARRLTWFAVDRGIAGEPGPAASHRRLRL